VKETHTVSQTALSDTEETLTGLNTNATGIAANGA